MVKHESNYLRWLKEYWKYGEVKNKKEVTYYTKII